MAWVFASGADWPGVRGSWGVAAHALATPSFVSFASSPAGRLVASLSSLSSFPSPLGAVPTLGGVGFLHHCDSVGMLWLGAGVDGVNDHRPGSVG